MPFGAAVSLAFTVASPVIPKQVLTTTIEACTSILTQRIYYGSWGWIEAIENLHRYCITLAGWGQIDCKDGGPWAAPSLDRIPVV